MLAQAEEKPREDLATTAEARDSEGSPSPSSGAARTTATLKPTSYVDDAKGRSCSAAANVAVEATSITAAAAAVAAASEAGAVVAQSPAVTMTSAAAIPSVEPKDSSPRGSKQIAREAAANDGERRAGGGKNTEGWTSVNGGERRAGGSSRHVRGSGRSCRPTGAVEAEAAASTTAMAASISIDKPKGDSSAKGEALLPSTSREQGSACDVGEEVVRVAPPGSLVRLKKRRQQARTRASNQR